MLFTIFFYIAYAYNYANWMTFIDDSLLLTDLSLPGSYSSGMKDITQSLSIEDQLNAGVRFFDFTLQNDTLQIYFEQYNSTYTYYQTQDIFVNFLNKYSSEFLVVKITQKNNNFSDVIQKYIQYYWSNYTVPKIKDLRKKIFIIQDYFDNNSLYFKYTDSQVYNEIYLDNCNTSTIKNNILSIESYITSIYKYSIYITIPVMISTACTIESTSLIINPLLNTFINNATNTNGIISYSYVSMQYAYSIISKNKLIFDQRSEVILMIVIFSYLIVILIALTTINNSDIKLISMKTFLCCFSTTMFVIKVYYYSLVAPYRHYNGNSNIDYLIDLNTKLFGCSAFFSIMSISFTYIISSVIYFYNVICACCFRRISIRDYEQHVLVYTVNLPKFRRMLLLGMSIYGCCTYLHIKKYIQYTNATKTDYVYCVCVLLNMIISFLMFVVNCQMMFMFNVTPWLIFPNLFSSVCVILIHIIFISEFSTIREQSDYQIIN